MIQIENRNRNYYSEYPASWSPSLPFILVHITQTICGDSCLCNNSGSSPSWQDWGEGKGWLAGRGYFTAQCNISTVWVNSLQSGSWLLQDPLSPHRLSWLPVRTRPAWRRLFNNNLPPSSLPTGRTLDQGFYMFSVQRVMDMILEEIIKVLSPDKSSWRSLQHCRPVARWTGGGRHQEDQGTRRQPALRLEHHQEELRGVSQQSWFIEL